MKVFLEKFAKKDIEKIDQSVGSVEIVNSLEEADFWFVKGDNVEDIIEYLKSIEPEFNKLTKAAEKRLKSAPPRAGIKYYTKGQGVLPLTDAAGITKVFNWPSHKGLDIGWWAMNNCPVLAWQGGTVVHRGYGSEVGNFIVLEHIYSDCTKRWTGYIHLADYPSVVNGESFSLGQQIGNARRGNTGNSNGEHLHIYLTSDMPQSTGYTWNTMLSKSIDPFPFMGWSKEFNTKFISTAWTTELKKIVYPTPVERNIKVHQVNIKSDTRRLRATPSINGTIYNDYCTKGIYNVLDMTFIDEYTWAKIGSSNGNNFWVAVMSGEDLPAKVYNYPKPVERNELVEQVDIKSDTRRLRAKPSVSGTEYDELCKKGIYNVLKWDTADGYDWALIGEDGEDQYWVAVMPGEDLPVVKDYKELYEAEKAKNEKLTAQIAALEKDKESLNKMIKEKEEEIKKLETEIKESAAELIKAKADIETLTKKLKEINKLSNV